MTNALIFLIGLISSQKINFGGEIYIGEILSILVIGVSFKRISLPSEFKGLFGLLLVWVLCQLCSDIYNDTQYLKAAKGILAPVLFGLTMMALNTFFRGRDSAVPKYLFGVVVGLWVGKAFAGSGYYSINPWKWGLGLSVALCFYLWVEFYATRSKTVYLVIATPIFCIVSLAFSARSLAGFFLIANLISILSARIFKNPAYRVLVSQRYGVFYCFLLIVLLVFALDRALFALFVFQPFLDILPPEDAWKYSVQATNAWGVILGGRTEILVSLEAFFDAPFLGHGSWAENKAYVYRHLDRVAEAGGLLHSLEVAQQNIDSFLIPSHSYLMGALVWGGIGAGLFWLKVLVLCLSGFLRRSVVSSPLQVYISIFLIWSILFSPFSANAR